MSKNILEQILDLLKFPANTEQRDVITAPLSPGVVIAGAGSGKTTVMAARVLYLIGTGQVRPGDVLGLTFTNKAAGEFFAKVRDNITKAQRALGGAFDVLESDTDPAISTYHAFAQRLLAEHGLRIGVEPEAELLTAGAVRRIAFRTLLNTKVPLQHISTGPQWLVKPLLALDAGLVENCVEPEQLLEFDARVIADLMKLEGKNRQKTAEEMIETAQKRQELVGLVTEFRSAKLASGGRDFTDQMRYVRHLAENRPEVGALLREQYKVVLLDEYQDTSIAQRRFLYSFFGNGHPVTAVGDPFQAIYGWRGASVHNINGFKDHFAVATDGTASIDVKVFNLPTNYRSTPRILAAANDVAVDLHQEHHNVLPLQAGSSLAHGPWRLALLEKRVDEAQWAARETQRVWAQILEQERSGVRPVPEAKDRHLRMAVLCRDSDGMQDMARELDALGVPYEVEGIEGLLSVPVVAELIAYLKVLHDPTENAALIRLLTGPRWNIGPRDLAVLGQRAGRIIGAARKHSEATDPSQALDEATAGFDSADLIALCDALDDLGDAPLSVEARQRLELFANELRELRRHAGDPMEDFIVRVLRTTGLDVEMRMGDELAAQRAHAAVGQFLDLVTEASDGGHVSLGMFLSYLNDLARFEGAEPKAERPGATDAVRLMTVHRAKGLEFTAVVLPFLADRVFPSDQSRSRWPKSYQVVPAPLIDEPDPALIAGFPNYVDGPRKKDFDAFAQESRRLELLEEQRLAYVAVTRAKEFLIASAHWWGTTQVDPYGPSPYLLALKEHALEGEVDLWCEPPLEEKNPHLDEAHAAVAWPRERNAQAMQRRHAAAQLFANPISIDSLSEQELQMVAEWDRDIDLLIAEMQRSRSDERVVSMPVSLTTSAFMKYQEDPQAFVENLARPMPVLISPAADRGTAFHAWVEERWQEQVQVLTDDDLEGAADDDLLDEDLIALKAAFEAGPFANDKPHRVEVPFSLMVGGRPIRGRIDAVFARGDRWQVIDWKTSAKDQADPLQLAVYRLAWAQIAGCDPALVDAGFHYVRSGNTQMVTDLPGLEDLNQMLS